MASFIQHSFIDIKCQCGTIIRVFQSPTSYEAYSGNRNENICGYTPLQNKPNCNEIWSNPSSNGIQICNVQTPQEQNRIKAKWTSGNNFNKIAKGSNEYQSNFKKNDRHLDNEGRHTILNRKLETN